MSAERDAPPTDARSRPGKVAAVVVVIGAMLLLLALGMSLLAPFFRSRRETAYRKLCGAQLKTLGLAHRLYANDYTLYPHMVAHDSEQGPVEVSKVWRSLVMLGYLDGAEGLTCPSSADIPPAAPGAIARAPRRFTWQGLAEDEAPLPIFGGEDPAVLDNRQLSYTGRKRALTKAAAGPRDLIAGDQDIAVEGREGGNHSDGLNLLYSDGHVRFARLGEASIRDALGELVYDGSALSARGAD